MNSGGATNTYANYMTIRALESGLVVSVDTTYDEPFYYCIHSEGEWKILNRRSSTPSIDAGDAISFKSNREPNQSEGIGTFVITKTCSLEGNCMSLLYGDDVVEKPMKPYGFYSLFRYNAMIRSVSEDFLPATTLATNCYRYIFSDCSSLTNAPKLPSMDLQPYCYYGMFDGCTSLVDAPVLPATTLVSQCYTQMFYNCTKMNYIKAMFTTTPSITYTDSWVYGVAASGTFVKNKNATWTATGNSYAPKNWTIITE